VGSLTFSPDGKRLAGIEPYPEGMVAFVARPVRLWDAATGRLTTQLGGADGGQSPATTNAMRKSALPAPWVDPRPAGGRALDTLAISFSPDGRTLAAGYADTRPLRPWRPEKGPPVILWDVEAGKERGRFEGHLDSVPALAFSPDGRLLATGSDDTTVLIWDVGATPGR
jgi:WD40 repeat protein